MLRVDAILFSNVATAVQRTAHLPGGDIRGLPGGLVVEGLKGVGSFAAEIADAHNEFKLGRVHNAAQRVRQIEMQFNSLVGRWNGSIGSIISSARQGKQGLSLQKLNEVKNAQSKMQQLASPAGKAFRDLISALDYAISAAQELASEDASKPDDREAETTERGNHSLGTYAIGHELDQQLQLVKDVSGTARIVPKLEVGRRYLFIGWEPPKVLRIEALSRHEVVLIDEENSQITTIDSKQLKTLLREQIWSIQRNA